MKASLKMYLVVSPLICNILYSSQKCNSSLNKDNLIVWILANQASETGNGILKENNNEYHRPYINNPDPVQTINELEEKSRLVQITIERCKRLQIPIPTHLISDTDPKTAALARE